MPSLSRLLLSVSLLLPCLASAANTLIPAGFGRTDLSPTNAVRLMGYAARANIPAPTNTAQRLHARALALGEGTNAIVLATLDNCILPGAVTTRIRARIHAITGLPTNNLTLAVTHTHSAPCLSGAAPNIFARDISPADHAAIDAYTEHFITQTEAAILQALADRRPARLDWGQGRVAFARNRRTPGGPVDHALPLLRVTDPQGHVRGLFLNYACHCTTLSGEFNASHGDWAGVAALDLESSLPESTALVAIGCGADSNPHPRGTIALVEQHGRTLATEARRLLELPLTPLTNPPVVRHHILQIPFRAHFTPAEWARRATNSGIVGYHASRWINRIAQDGPPPATLPYPIQTCTFGRDLALVFLGGEVVVDYALRLKAELDPARIWVNGYANAVPGYIPSRRILQEGGYEAESSLWYYDQPQQFDPAIEDLIIHRVLEDLRPRFAPDPPKGEMTPPREARRALESFSLPQDLTISLVADDSLVQSPVAIDFAMDGRLWVAEMADYPAGASGRFEPGGRIKVLDDLDRDGRFDRATVVATNIPFPTGILAWESGILVAAAPDLLLLTPGATTPEPLFTGFATHNYQARVNGLRWGLDGWIHGAGGLFGGSITNRRSASVTDATGRDFRFHPDTGRFQALPGISQQGRTRDDFDHWFGNDNGSLLWHYPLPPDAAARDIDPPRARIPANRDDNRVFPTSRTLNRFNDPHTANHLTSACAPEIYRAHLLGPAFHGNAFVCEPVHNLVRRAVLSRDGLAFAARRHPDDAQSEFLASSDNWFRPVEVRTGPDGALWIVDMYRFVIEHTRWIPAERLRNLDPRAGSDRGRIYVVHPRTSPLAPLPTLHTASPEELVQALQSPNGPLRDLAHRRWLQLSQALPATPLPTQRLHSAFLRTTNPAVRVQIAAVLDQTVGLHADDLAGLLQASQPDVARFALTRLSDQPAHHALVRQHADRLATDPATRLALACTFERMGTEGASQLADLLLAHPGDEWVLAVARKSAQTQPDAFIARFAANPTRYLQAQSPLAPVLDLLSRTATPDRISELLTTLAPDDVPPDVALAWLARIDRRPGRATDLHPAARTRLDRWSRDVAPRAPSLAADPTLPVAVRMAAVRALPTTRPESLAALLPLLDAPIPTPLRTAILEQVAANADPATPVALLANWNVLSLPRRTERLGLLLSRPNWTRSLLEALQAGTVVPGDLSPQQREHLRQSREPEIQARAIALLPPPSPGRTPLVQRYLPSLQAQGGNPASGQQLFDQFCAACHQVRGRGEPVGPDLAPYRLKPAADFLLAVLDPNAAIDARATACNVVTRDGRELTGIPTDESSEAFTLVQAGGTRTRFTRSEIRRIEPSLRSLMPEGLEESIDPSQMADLHAWITRAIPDFGSATPPAQADALRRWSESNPTAADNLRSVNPALAYPSWIGTHALHFCRQNIGQDRLSWEARFQPGTTPARFIWPAAMGFFSQPAGGFTLQIGGQPVLQFDVALEDAEWTSADRAVVLRYHVEERNAEDSNGRLECRVDPRLLPDDGRLHFSIQAANASSQRWFGLYHTATNPTGR